MTKEGQDSASFNMAQLYYEELQQIDGWIAQAYMEKDVREFWHRLVFLYDNIYCHLNKKERERLNAESARIEEDIYRSVGGDQLDSFYSEGEGNIREFRRQMSVCRRFYRSLRVLMQNKGMIVPMSKWQDPTLAVLNTGDY